jgi:predicted kinase
MILNMDKIVVSNTFTQEWELEKYFELAKKYGYKTFSIVVENRHGGTNVHEVPEEKLEQMRNRFSIKL